MKKKVTLRSLKDTETLAKTIAKDLRGGEVIALSGPLGAGKTTFTQYFAKALGVKRDVKSPTFNIMHIHKVQKEPGTKKGARHHFVLCHVDAYRIDDQDELEAIGFYDYIGQPNVIAVIEWAEKIKKALPKNALWLTFKTTKQGRVVTTSGR